MTDPTEEEIQDRAIESFRELANRIQRGEIKIKKMTYSQEYDRIPSEDPSIEDTFKRRDLHLSATFEPGG